MLTCISGLPGHGKTLFTLQHVEQLRRESGRAVYQHGIKDLTLPWQELEDPKRWHDLPDGSIVVIDEAWQHFPKRPAGSKPPQHVELLAVHRHRGFDVVLVTQNPALQLDHFVRGLVGRHYHVRRVFGSARSRLYVWESLGNPDDYHSKKEAVTSWFKFPPEVFSWYKSAEVHTVKRSIPLKPFAIMGGGALLVGLLGWAAYAQLAGSVDRFASSSGEASAALEDGAPPPPRRSKSIEATSFVASVPGLPFTAPFYADSVKIEEVPIVSGCGVLKIGNTTRCRCDDQQGNQIPMDVRHCLATFEAGVFQPGRSQRYPDIEPYVPPLALPATAETPADQPQAGGGGSGADSQS